MGIVMSARRRDERPLKERLVLEANQLREKSEIEAGWSRTGRTAQEGSQVGRGLAAR